MKLEWTAWDMGTSLSGYFVYSNIFFSDSTCFGHLRLNNFFTCVLFQCCVVGSTYQHGKPENDSLLLHQQDTVFKLHYTIHHHYSVQMECWSSVLFIVQNKPCIPQVWTLIPVSPEVKVTAGACPSQMIFTIPTKLTFHLQDLRTATSHVSIDIHMGPTDVRVDGTLYSYVRSTHPTW